MHSVTGHEGHRIGNAYILTKALMANFHTLTVGTRAHPEKRDAISVPWIHVRLNFENKPGKSRLFRLDQSIVGCPGLGFGRQFNKSIQHLLYAKIAQGRTKVDGTDRGLFKVLLIKLMAGTANQIDFVDKVVVIHAQQFTRLVAVQPVNHSIGVNVMALTLFKAHQSICCQFVDTLELLAHANRPIHWRALYLQDVFNLVQHLNRITDLPVEFVDEGNDRRVAQTTHLHQFDGARLNALGTVDHHQSGIHRGKGAIGVLGEIFVPGRIQQIHRSTRVGKLHHRRGNRDATLLLHGHPV